jgi:hypothetical protein
MNNKQIKYKISNIKLINLTNIIINKIFYLYLFK